VRGYLVITDSGRKRKIDELQKSDEKTFRLPVVMAPSPLFQRAQAILQGFVTAQPAPGRGPAPCPAAAAEPCTWGDSRRGLGESRARLAYEAEPDRNLSACACCLTGSDQA
jgi:hypothetical protein